MTNTLWNHSFVKRKLVVFIEALALEVHEIRPNIRGQVLVIGNIGLLSMLFGRKEMCL